MPSIECANCGYGVAEEGQLVLYSAPMPSDEEEGDIPITWLMRRTAPSSLFCGRQPIRHWTMTELAGSSLQQVL